MIKAQCEFNKEEILCTLSPKSDPSSLETFTALWCIRSFNFVFILLFVVIRLIKKLKMGPPISFFFWYKVKYQREEFL